MRDYDFYYTQDGSIGLYSYADGDVYHSKYGALTEAWTKFVLPSNIDKLNGVKEQINVLDICYGVGYNTKSLMSYIINYNKQIFDKKYKLKNKKFNNKNYNIDAIDIDNVARQNNKILLEYNETLDNDKIVSKFNIDCLDINEELIKISPFLKTIKTPQEIYEKYVPKIFDCFELYWKIKKIVANCGIKYYLRNKKNISELLDLKFNNGSDEVNSIYKVNEYVNYILIDSLFDKFNDNYITKSLLKKFKEKDIYPFLDKNLIEYSKFKQDFRYNFISKFNLIAFLHNIYYDYLSIRYKKGKISPYKELFNIDFYINDARKSIFELNKVYDVIFLDAFTTSKTPELWTVEFIAELYNKISPNGLLITYSNAALVRNTFLENNFYIGKIVDKKTGKSIGTIASKNKDMIKIPLTNLELGLCSTKAGIPYHDYTLADSKEIILKRREQDFKTSDLMTASKYMKIRNFKKGHIE